LHRTGGKGDRRPPPAGTIALPLARSFEKATATV
jgi:hypothetical protein